MNELIVGVNESPASHRALSWAAEEAARRDVTLVAVTVAPPPAWLRAQTRPRGEWEAEVDAQRRRAQALLRALCAPLDARSLTVEREVIPGTPPARMLLDRARGSDGLVVGTRGRGRFASLLLGSVSQKVSVHPPCPITVVPAGPGEPDRRSTRQGTRGKIVVGVDTSAPARLALLRAAEEARLRGAVLEAVMVRKPPALPAKWSSSRTAAGVVWIGTTPVATPGLEPETERLRQEAMARWQSAAERLLDRQIGELTDRQRPHRIERLIITGTHPAEVLLDVASRADLLVVGSRGRGDVVGTLFGSVSRQCVRHASVPVMVVPSTGVPGARRVRSLEPVTVGSGAPRG